MTIFIIFFVVVIACVWLGSRASKVPLKSIQGESVVFEDDPPKVNVRVEAVDQIESLRRCLVIVTTHRVIIKQIPLFGGGRIRLGDAKNLLSRPINSFVVFWGTKNKDIETIYPNPFKEYARGMIAKRISIKQLDDNLSEVLFESLDAPSYYLADPIEIRVITKKVDPYKQLL